MLTALSFTMLRFRDRDTIATDPVELYILAAILENLQSSVFMPLHAPTLHSDDGRRAYNARGKDMKTRCSASPSFSFPHGSHSDLCGA